MIFIPGQSTGRDELEKLFSSPAYRRRPRTDIRVRDVDREERTLVAYASTKTVDSYGEVVLPDAFDLTRFRKNPVIPWAHDYRQPPVARALWVKADKMGLLFKPKFAETPFASDIFELYAGGFLSGFSIGYDELERVTPDSPDFERLLAEWGIIGEPKLIATRVLLYEISAVTLPANEDALVQAKARGILRSPEALELAVKAERTRDYKGATEFQDLPLAPEDREWDAAAARERVARWAGGPDKESIDWARYRMAFFWYDSENPENFGGYKLPFADVVGGELKAVWKGVAGSMAALLGARGGVNIPESDRRAVYNHIRKYYEKFDREPPEFKAVPEVSEPNKKSLETLPESPPRPSGDEIRRFILDYVPGRAAELLRREVRRRMGKVDLSRYATQSGSKNL